MDLYSPLLLVAFLTILLFNYADTYLTLTLIKHGIVTEANPFMALHLENGVVFFILNKFFITAISLIVICLFKNVSIARVGLPLSIIMYFSVVTYELYIIMRSQIL